MDTIHGKVLDMMRGYTNLTGKSPKELLLGKDTFKDLQMEVYGNVITKDSSEEEIEQRRKVQADPVFRGMRVILVDMDRYIGISIGENGQ